MRALESNKIFFNLNLNMSNSSHKKYIEIKVNYSSSKLMSLSIFISLLKNYYIYYYKDTTTSEKTLLDFNTPVLKMWSIFTFT